MLDSLLTFPLYLFYGMAFLAIGVSITSRDISASNLKIARPLSYFALFAYSHALFEWYTLYLILYSDAISALNLPWFSLTKLVLVLGSFLFLLSFGISLLCKAYPDQRQVILLLPFLLVGIVILGLPLSNLRLESFPFWLEDIRVRNYIGFPSAMIAGFGMIFFSQTLKPISDKGAWNFAGAGVALLVYGILTGLIPSGSFLFPVDVPVELCRGLLAFVILHFIMNSLHTFDAERKMQIEEHLQRFAKAEKLNSLGKLAFGVAHEINNPLANVSLSSERLREDLARHGELTESRVQMISSLERNLERASKIARELLFFSTDKGDDFQHTDLNELLHVTLDLLGTQRKEYQIELDLDPLPLLSVIPWKIEEVFLNLIGNAIEAIEPNGGIFISSRLESAGVIIRIEDNGMGIDENDLPRVMDPFFTTKSVGKGTGLGLSICFGIMELHGGHLEIDSHQGKGTIVTLNFPLEGEANVQNPNS